MHRQLVARLDRLPRLGRVILCGGVVALAMPLLSSLRLPPVLLLAIGIGLYTLGWLLWIGFNAELRPVDGAALLYVFAGAAAFILWVLYNLALLLLMAPA